MFIVLIECILTIYIQHNTFQTIKSKVKRHFSTKKNSIIIFGIYYAVMLFLLWRSRNFINQALSE